MTPISRSIVPCCDRQEGAISCLGCCYGRQAGGGRGTPSRRLHTRRQMVGEGLSHGVTSQLLRMLPSTVVTRNSFYPSPLMSFPFSVRSSGESCQIHPAFLPPAFPIRTPTGLLALAPQGVYQTCKGQSFTIDAILGCHKRVAGDAGCDTAEMRRPAKTAPRLCEADETPGYVSPLTCTATFRYRHTSLVSDNAGEQEH